MNKYIFERTIKRTFLSLYIVHFVLSINVLSKISNFKRKLIRKNEKNKKISKEQNSKEKNEFRKNVIRSNDLVPIVLLFLLSVPKILSYFLKVNAFYIK
jgi:hypothetical protein